MTDRLKRYWTAAKVWVSVNPGKVVAGGVVLVGFLVVRAAFRLLDILL